MTLMGIFLPDDTYREVKRLLEPTISVNFKTRITITQPGDKEAVRKRLDEYAASYGWPSLPDGQCYGLTSDRELVSP